MSSSVRNQCAELARAERITPQRENRDLITRYLQNVGEIERLRGIELAAGIAVEVEMEPLAAPRAGRNPHAVVVESNGNGAFHDLDIPGFAR